MLYFKKKNKKTQNARFKEKIGGDNTVFINGNWEQIKDLSDVVRIVKENISDEFVREVEGICGEPGLELEEQNFILENKIDNIEDRIKGIRELFIEVLNVDTNRLSKDEKNGVYRKI